MTNTMPVVASAQIPSTPQRVFLRYSTALLVNLVVLNLFAEFWDKVFIESFSYSLLTSVLLLILLKLTLAIEHRLARYFKSRQGKRAKIMHYVSAWLVLVVSKFAILAAVEFALGDALHFTGVLEGVVTFIVVVVVMLVAEEAMVRFYRRLG